MAKKTPTTNTLPAALLKITETSGIAITEAQSIGFKFAPFMQKVNEISMQIEAIERDNPTPEDAALARRLRLSLVENRGIKGLATVHKDLKAESLIRGRLIDSFRSVVEQTSEMSELIAERIEKHSERVEAERQLQLSNDRKLLLAPYGTDTEYLPLGKLTDEQFGKILANEKLLFEAKKAELERLEAVRIAQEVEAERLRAEQLRLDNERKETERVENERVKKELAELERIEQERQQKEIRRIEAEQMKVAGFSQRLLNHGFELINPDADFGAKKYVKLGFSLTGGQMTLMHDKEVGEIILSAQAAEQKEIQAELKAEKLAKENQKKLAEQQRIAEVERKKQFEILAKQQEAAKVEREKQLAELAKQQEIARKAQAELQAKKDAENKILADQKAKELAALAAPDKEKIRVLYNAIKGIAIPDLQTEPGKEIAVLTAKRIKELLAEIVVKSNKLI